MHGSIARPRADTLTLRRAGPDDAGFMVWAANAAADGLPLHLWTGLARPGEDPWAVGRARAARPDGAFSYANGWIAERAGRPAGCLIGYPLPDRPEPVANDMPAILRPVQELENAVPGSWYVNILAVDPAARRQGVARRLLDQADACAQATGQSVVSLIVVDSNAAGRTFYDACGFAQTARRPMVKDGWAGEGEAWLLMTKAL